MVLKTNITNVYITPTSTYIIQYDLRDLPDLIQWSVFLFRQYSTRRKALLLHDNALLLPYNALLLLDDNAVLHLVALPYHSSK